jgi:hypothetical protein
MKRHLEADHGHVFIVRGDLLDLACDAVLVPTDAALTIEGPWQQHVDALEHRAGPASSAAASRDGWITAAASSDGVYGPFAEKRHYSARETWIVATGVAPPDADLSERDRLEAAIELLREVLLRFARAFRDRTRTSSARGCPLVAVPLLGYGEGGFAGSFRRYATALVKLLEEVAVEAKVDIALVVWGALPEARALEALCRVARGGREPARVSASWQMGETARAGDSQPDPATTIERLLDRARAGELVPFFGAGVSLAGGAPSWSELVRQLDRDRKIDEAGASELDLLAQAQIVANSYASESEFAREISERLRDTPISLQHLLLAALDARDAVTTNFDDAYERAVEASGRGRVAVVPQQAHRRRLLKLHGSLERTTAKGTTEGPQGLLPPVLTQDQFLEHEHHSGPLRGALQMMLLTGHVLFIGYSLRDPGLHAAIHEVRRIRKLAGVGDEDAPLATALQVEPSRQLSYLWSPTIDVLWPREASRDASGNARPRDLEILLDALGDAAALHALPVLAFPPEQLEDDEVKLRELLEALKSRFKGDPPHHVRVFLEAYGDALSAQAHDE